MQPVGAVLLHKCWPLDPEVILVGISPKDVWEKHEVTQSQNYLLYL